MKLMFTRHYIYILILILKQSIGILNINNINDALVNNLNFEVFKNIYYLEKN